jgi:opacity protein-like surface antigen
MTARRLPSTSVKKERPVNRLRVVLATSTLLVATAATAVAQQPGPQPPTARPATSGRVAWLDLSAGYAVTHDSGTDQTLPAGWVGTLGVRFHPNVSAVGEIGGSYKTLTLNGVKYDYRLHDFMGGVRVNATERSRVMPFGQFLVGAACYCGTTIHPSNSFATAFSWEVGGGADVPVAGPIAARIQVDGRQIRDGSNSFHQIRFAIGAVLALPRE